MSFHELNEPHGHGILAGKKNVPSRFYPMDESSCSQEKEEPGSTDNTVVLCSQPPDLLPGARSAHFPDSFSFAQ